MGYVRKGLEEPPQREPGRGRGVLGGSPHPPHPAGQEAPNLEEEEEEGRVKQTGVTRAGPPREGEDTLWHASILSHTLQMQVAGGSTCCTRERRRSKRRQRGRLPRKSQEPHISKRAPQVTQPVCTLQPRISRQPPSYLRPWVPPFSSPPFFSTLFPSSSFLITGSSLRAACRGGARNAALPANRHLTASHWSSACVL